MGRVPICPLVRLPGLLLPLALLLALCATAVSARQSDDIRLELTPAARCVAHADRGMISGHVASQSSSVCEWLGIPYAAAPVGNLRFAPPEKLTTKGDFNAGSYGPDCPQSPSRVPFYPNTTAQFGRIWSSFVSTDATTHTQSEDCLTLNIWRPLSASDSALPVLVWIHGGRHNSGTSNTPFYNGARLSVAQSLVVVTLNFRMNIFGFPGSPEATQNVGLLDHYAAVQWLSDNAASFGGDPRRITVAGQSSGAVAASNWAYAFRDRPLVAGAIAHSGNQFSFPTNTLQQASTNWFAVTNQLGCGGADNASHSTLQCMRSPHISFESILNATRYVPPSPSASPTRASPPFQATQDNLTFFSAAQYLAMSSSSSPHSSPKLATSIPYLQIHGDHESGFYRVSAYAAGSTSSSTTTITTGTILPECAWSAFEADSFTCASAAEAFYRARMGTTTFRARYMADFTSTRLYEGSGAYHGVEIYEVSGNAGLVSGIEDEEEGAQVELREKMQRAWGAFVRDTEGGLRRGRREEGLGWPVYGGEGGRGRDLVRIGRGSSSRIEFVDPGVYDGVCAGRGLDFWSAEIDSGQRWQEGCA